MAKKSLPAAVTIVAILNFVGAGFGLCCAEIPALAGQIFGTSSMMSGLKGMGPAGNKAVDDVQKLEKFQDKELPSHAIYVYASTFLNMFVSLLMVISGIGLLMLKPWGRLLALLYVPCSLLMRLCGVGYLLAIFNPMMMRWYDTQKDLPPDFIAGQKFGLYIGSFFGLVFLVYPVVVLFLMTRPSVVQAFAQRQEPSHE